MAPRNDSLPIDLAAAHALVLAQHEALAVAEAKAAAAESVAKSRALEIERLKYQIAKLKHEQYGQSSERSAVLEQLELALSELEEDASEAEAAAQLAAERAKVKVNSFERRKPARRPLPAHLPRERIVYPSPAACPCCGGALHKLGEDVTETLEMIPRQWKVIAHVREKLSCRTCEQITQPPAPSHPIARGRAGPGLLAHILFAKYGLHLPLNRQSATYAREGIDLDVSTLADWVGACAATLMPLVLLIRAYVFAAERIHADETTVKVQAKGQCRTGRLWTYVRDDQPFGGLDPPAAAYFYSPDRGGKHPEEHLAGYAGLMQADAYAGFNRLYAAARKPVRNERSRPLVDALETWLREQRRKLSARNEIAKAIQYSLNRWIALTRFLDDGRLCMSNNAAERALRGIAIGRHNWTFAGSDEGGRRAAAIYTLIETAKLNDVDPQAWLTDILARLQDHPAKRIDELLPWNWKRARPQKAAA